MTVGELVYMCLDELKISSDDAYFTEEHIIFLASKYRSFLLKQRYGSDIKKTVPESNYQTLCIPVVEASIEDNVCYAGPRLVSTYEIPLMLELGSRRIFADNDFSTIYFTLVSRDRFVYAGVDKWMQNIIYATIGPDRKLYLKSSNPQHLYLENVKLNGVFEDFQEASQLECKNLLSSTDSSGNSQCTIKPILERDFPIEDPLVQPLIELIVRELSGAIYKPEDTNNNAADDLNKVSVASDKK